MTNAPEPRRLTLHDMEVGLSKLIAEHRPSGQPVHSHLMAVTRDDFDVLEAARRFITWVIPYESRIREFKGRTRA